MLRVKYLWRKFQEPRNSARGDRHFCNLSLKIRKDSWFISLTYRVEKGGKKFSFKEDDYDLDYLLNEFRNDVPVNSVVCYPGRRYGWALKCDMAASSRMEWEDVLKHLRRHLRRH